MHIVGLEPLVRGLLWELVVQFDLVIRKLTRDYLGLVAFDGAAKRLRAGGAQGASVLLTNRVRKFSLETLQKPLIINALGFEVV